MTENTTDQTVTRHNARKRRRRPRQVLAVLVSIGVFCLIALAGVVGLSLTHEEARVAKHDSPDPAKRATTGQATGRVVVVGHDNCRETSFNNRTGRMRNDKTIPCPENMSASGGYHYPGNRLQGIRKGFSER